MMFTLIRSSLLTALQLKQSTVKLDRNRKWRFVKKVKVKIQPNKQVLKTNVKGKQWQSKLWRSSDSSAEPC